MTIIASDQNWPLLLVGGAWFEGVVVSGVRESGSVSSHSKSWSKISSFSSPTGPIIAVTQFTLFNFYFSCHVYFVNPASILKNFLIQRCTKNQGESRNIGRDVAFVEMKQGLNPEPRATKENTLSNPPVPPGKKMLDHLLRDKLPYERAGKAK